MEKQADAYIQLNHIVKRFGEFTALDHVSLTIPKGTFVTLLGPSGCGKTTLMRQIAGFSEPDEGDVIIDGNRMNGLPPYKRNTPLVFQEYALFPHMTVYENISYGLRLKKLPKEEISRKVADMLEMFNLTGLEGRFPKEMSGGQQQRVAFARALIMTTKERIADEALTLFSTRGYKGTSVKNIAAAVGIKDSSLYKHFKSKKDIFDTIVTEMQNRMVQQQFQLDPFTNTLFLFCGRRRDRIKGLYWERDGFILLYKRLEQGTYQWPRSENEVRTLTPQQYRWLMEGLQIEQARAHRPVAGLSMI